jgi:hypothetical protein
MSEREFRATWTRAIVANRATVGGRNLPNWPGCSRTPIAGLATERLDQVPPPTSTRPRPARRDFARLWQAASKTVGSARKTRRGSRTLAHRSFFRATAAVIRHAM